MSSAFDWENRELHVETIQEDLLSVPWVLLELGGSQGDLVHDPFGATVHGCDVELSVGGVYRIGETEMAWHAEPVPTLARVLRACTRAEAERLVGGKLTRRRFYYEVLID